MARQDVTIELFYGGAWHQVPAFKRDSMTIVRGDGDEQSDTPASLKLSLDDRLQRFNPRNPAGPLYGLIGRNTPIRVTYPGDARFYGEAASWKPQRSPEFVLGSGRGSAWCEVEASGVRRRFEQGADPLPSALRSFMDAQAGVTGYWSGEDGAQATAPSNAVPGGAAASVVDVAFGADSTLPASAGALTFNSADSLFRARLAVQPATGFISVVMLFKLNALPSATPVELFRLTATGSAAAMAIAADDNGFFRRVYDREGTALVDAESAHQVDVTKWVAIHFGLSQQSPGTIAYAFYRHQATVGGDNPIFAATGTFAGTLGRGIELTIGADAQLAQAKFAHAIVTNAAFPFVTNGLLRAVDAWAGWETTLDRLARLCGAAGIAFTSDGDAVELLGAQLPAPLLDLLGEAQRTDDGKLFEPRGSLGLHYRTRRDLYAQDPALILDWASGAVKPPLQPVVDDLGTRNDVTVKNAGGGEASAVLPEGPLSVQPPPAGVGRYPTTVDVSHHTDERLPALASWHLHKGTVDETRYAKVTVDVDQVPAAAAVDVGDRILIEHLPDSTGEADLIVLGYTEVIENHRRRITFTCAPYAPHDTGTWNDPSGPILYSFDSTSQGWAGEPGVVVARVTTPTHDGAGALRATKTMGAGFDAIRFNDASGQPDNITGNGPMLAMWALVPAGAAGTAWAAHIEVQDSTFTWQPGPNFTLTKGTWALLTWEPPAALMANSRAIGVQFEAVGVNASQAVYIDTVKGAAPTSARYDTLRSTTSGSTTTGTSTSLPVVTTGGIKWTTNPAHHPLDVGLRGARVRVTDIDPYFADDFNRSAASGWGNGWTNSGGAAADYSCNGSDGLISLASINASRRLWRPETFGEVHLLACFESSHLGVGDDIEFSAAVHMQDQGTYVHLGCFLDGDGTNADLQIVRRVANTPTTISNVRTLSAFQSVGGDRWLRFLATGGVFYGKAWAGLVTDEPRGWMVSGSDGTFTPGLAGLRGNLQAAYSGALPVTLTVHSFDVVNPQTFTLDPPPVNGVAKIIPSGSQVRLWRPRRYGL